VKLLVENSATHQQQVVRPHIEKEHPEKRPRVAEIVDDGHVHVPATAIAQGYKWAATWSTEQVMGISEQGSEEISVA
jgi:hypothetical protein